MPVSGLKFAIPPDLDTSDLTCFRIMWPNTPHWRSILAGLIYMVARGRTWDERSGSVIAARDAGMSLFDVNVPLVFCDETSIPPETPIPPIFGAWSGEWWEESGECDMSSSGPCAPLKIENGVLYWWSCCAWQEIGPITGEGQPLEPEEIIPPPDDTEPTTGSACGAAVAILDAVWSVAESISNHLNPLTLVKEVRADNPGLSLSQGYIWSAYLEYLQIIILDALDPLDPATGPILWDEEAIFDPERAQRLLCAYQNKFNDAYEQPSRSQIKAFWELARGIYPVFVVSFIQQCTLAISIEQLQEIGLHGTQIPDAECTCPGSGLEFSEPTANGWYFGAELSDLVITNDGTEGWKQGCITDNPTHDVFGAFWQVLITGDTTAQWAAQNIAGGPCEGLGTNLWSDSSQPSVTVNCAVGVSAVLTEVLGPGRFVISAGGFPQTSDPQAPAFAAGAALAGEFQVGWNKAATLTITKFRWLYNVNSPSHGA